MRRISDNLETHDYDFVVGFANADGSGAYIIANDEVLMRQYMKDCEDTKKKHIGVHKYQKGKKCIILISILSYTAENIKRGIKRAINTVVAESGSKDKVEVAIEDVLFDEDILNYMDDLVKGYDKYDFVIIEKYRRMNNG